MNEQFRPIGICFYCGKMTRIRIEVQGIRLPFCDWACRGKWAKVEKADIKKPRRRR